MRRIATLALVIIFSITQSHVAEAGYSLKVIIKGPSLDNNLFESVAGFHSPHALVGTSEDLKYKKQMLALAKASNTKKLATNSCKEPGWYKARVKVLDARGGTAGLGNLTQVTVTNIRVLRGIDSLPKMSIAEFQGIMEQSPDSEVSEWPDYVENGYVFYTVAFNCLFSGSISIISSNSYQIYVAPDLKPKGEYSKSELSKMKWTVTYQG